MSTPTPFQSPLPAGVPVTGHNVLLMFASDIFQGLSDPAAQALSSVIANRADPAKVPGGVAVLGAQLVADGTITLEQMLVQLAQLSGYGLTKLPTLLTPSMPAPSVPTSPPTPPPALPQGSSTLKGS